MLERELEVALEAARRGADAVMQVYAAPFEVSFKGEDDPVTAADRSANAIIVEALARAFPDDAIVAEESPVPEVRGRRAWFVDPLDGTKELIARNGEFCVMIGLAIDGKAELGVLVVPALPFREGEPNGFALVGARGRAFALARDGEHPLVASRLDDPSRATFVVSRSRRSPRLDSLFAALGGPRELRCGSVGVKIARLLLGQADAYVHPSGGTGVPKLWDLCAPEALAVAAGARFTDERGAPIDYAAVDVGHAGGIVVGPPALHQKVIDAIARGTLAPSSAV